MKKIHFLLLLAFISLSTSYYAQDDVAVGDSTALVQAKAEQYYNTGIEKFNAQDLAGAILDFDTAISIAPTFEKALFNRGSVYYQSTDFDAAITDFSRVIELNPDTNNAYYFSLF